VHPIDDGHFGTVTALVEFTPPSRFQIAEFRLQNSKTNLKCLNSEICNLADQSGEGCST
jgi:hypothetical protein